MTAKNKEHFTMLRISLRYCLHTLLAFSVISLIAFGLFSRRALHSVSSASSLASAPPVKDALDANDLLVLHFDNSLIGESGETPTQALGVTFAAGVSGQGVQVDSGDLLKYATAGNFNAPAGTIEFWIKPLWNGSNTTARYFFSVGNNQLLLVKDGANNFRFFLKSDDSEAYQGYNLNNWVANEWHHVAVTWSVPGRMKTYFDGTLVIDHASANQDLISPVPTELFFGGNGTGVPAAIIDEFRLSGIERTSQEIASRMVASLTVSSWSLNPATPSIEMYPGWFYWVPLNINAVTNIGSLSLPVLAASWTSSNPAVAVMDASGRFRSLAPGSTTLAGTLGSQSNSVTVNVLSPALSPTEETIEPFMATPASGYLHRMPVVIIRYFPTRDGVNLDPVATGTTTTLAALKNTVEQIERRHKFMLEEGSRFRGYSNPAAQPALGYQIIKIITVYEEVPLGFSAGADAYFPDYNQILSRFGGENFVNNLGVKEFWIVQQHYGRVGINESNMSSPTTGDISNSYRTTGDQPVFNKTYVTYGINFTRSQAEATHNHGHQLEAIMSYVNQGQDGNTNLWWQQFARAANNPPARAGNTHFPPNATVDYDYTNLNLVASDIMDWRPAGGTTTMVNANTWGNVPYAWPSGVAPPQQVESKWYIFWFQSFAGRDNTIPYNTNKMTNWWQFTGDWDGAIQAGIGLHEPSFCTYTLGATTQAAPMAGGTYTVGVSCGSGCKWFASSNEPWITVTSGRTGNGNGSVTFTVSANPGGARVGTLALGGQSFTVSQDGTCSANCPTGTLTANPNPILVCNGATTSSTTLSWSTTNVTATRIHLGSASGTILTSGGANGSFLAANTVTNGLQFFLVNATNGATLASTTVNFTTNGCANLTNLALNKVATQSSTYAGGVASRAVDGNANGDFSTNSVTHTNADAQAWWQVDLGSLATLDTIHVWNRTGCCGERLSAFYVFVSDVPFTSTSLSTTQNQAGVSSFYTAGQGGTPTSLTINRTGRYVRVQLAGSNYLSLAEVQVMGTGGGVTP